ncbi:hypothetical protein GH714_012176 [Hevea brasiliensis]|uniref:PPM-type phosphatase domain-containing protein n=1 Tax=Hevea brasiliensis TaxID=3981 RepID=A0A6A6MX40_HEVBR|nr:hypothetical protein GH714_012176 [Hevea brasiliensis]
MAEQTEKAFLKQPKVFLCSKKSGKGKRPAKLEIDSGNPLDWVSRLPEKQLKNEKRHSNIRHTYLRVSVLKKEIMYYWAMQVFDGHGGKRGAHFVRDHLPRVIVEDADFPLNLRKWSQGRSLRLMQLLQRLAPLSLPFSSGTTALTAMIFGRSLLVANAGDCLAVLSRRGTAIKFNKLNFKFC